MKKTKDGEEKVLLECIKENLNHCRHIESQRLSIASIYVAVLGIMIALASSEELMVQKNFVVVVLFMGFCIGCISLALTIRWNQVFRGHKACAIYCYKELFKSISDETEPETCYRSENQELLPYYPFDFDGRLLKKSTSDWFVTFYKFTLVVIIICIMVLLIKIYY